MNWAAAYLVFYAASLTLGTVLRIVEGPSTERATKGVAVCAMALHIAAIMCAWSLL